VNWAGDDDEEVAGSFVVISRASIALSSRPRLEAVRRKPSQTPLHLRAWSSHLSRRDTAGQGGALEGLLVFFCRGAFLLGTDFNSRGVPVRRPRPSPEKEVAE